MSTATHGRRREDYWPRPHLRELSERCPCGASIVVSWDAQEPAAASWGVGEVEAFRRAHRAHGTLRMIVQNTDARAAATDAIDQEA